MTELGGEPKGDTTGGPLGWWLEVRCAYGGWDKTCIYVTVLSSSVRHAGLEPAASGVRDRRSSYEHMAHVVSTS